MYLSSMIDKLTDVIVKHPKDAFISSISAQTEKSKAGL